jgi:hypothetical protein
MYKRARKSYQVAFRMKTTSPQLQTEADMIKAILPLWRDGRTPVQRNTFYEPIRVLESSLTATTETETPSGKSKVQEDNLATA